MYLTPPSGIKALLVLLLILILTGALFSCMLTVLAMMGKQMTCQHCAVDDIVVEFIEDYSLIETYFPFPLMIEHSLPF